MDPMRLSLASLFLAVAASSGTATGPQVPAMFVFGDSLVDPGNNNKLFTMAKADYAPNGVDFPGGATGRFCNGRTVVDHLGELLGLPLIPPFNSPATSGSQILHGVNYASAASGILNETGIRYGERLPMDKQVRNFEKTVEDLNSQMGEVAEELLKNSLFFVGMGNNDYINNYLRPFTSNPKGYTPEDYTQLLIQHYSRQLKNLYKRGGRKFLIAGLGPLGCTPNQRKHGKNVSSCANRTNRLALQFNSNLKDMLQDLNAHLPGSYFLYWDTYSITMDVIDNFSQYGFRFPHTACCGGGRLKGKIVCLPLLPMDCRDRSEFVFWDPYHPTDAFNAIAAKQAFDGSLQSEEPMNVQELVQL